MRVPLPIDAVLDPVVQALRRKGAVVLHAPTGTGKTTRVPPALLDAGLAGERRIVVLEPRRVAARAAARWMAEQRGEPLGATVGYQVRFDRRAGPQTRILVATEGIVTRMLQDDPFLEDVAVLVFDEFHERSLHADLALAMARRVREEARPDLAVVVMSATLDPEPIAAYLGGCPVVRATGRLHPVDVRFAPRQTSEPLHLEVARATLQAVRETDGNVLVFLPGLAEIRRAEETLADAAARQGLAVMPLHGELPPERQDAALRAGPERKVVLATNVAETSVTIEGVTAVVDTGLVRQLRRDPGCDLDRLETQRVSVASADQRAGRAGRQGPGLCLRLWTRSEHTRLAPRDEPEIRRVDLSAPVLELACWGESDLTRFPWFEAPDGASLARADALLRELGALGPEGPTTVGREMARLPIHPRLARALLAARAEGCVSEVAMVAALLSERDPFRDRPTADVLDRLAELRRTRSNASRAAARVLAVARQLSQLVGGDGATTSTPAGSEATLARALMAGFPDRLARAREPGGARGVLAAGRGVVLPAPIGADLFLCLDVDAGRRGERAEARVRLAMPVEEDWLPKGAVSSDVALELDPERDLVRAVARRRLGTLVLDEQPAQLPPDADVGAVLAAAAADRLDEALPLDAPPVRSLLLRLAFVGRHVPDASLPQFGERELRALLPELCFGRRSFAELRAIPLAKELKARLSHTQRKRLDELAPERLELPSGTSARLDYQEDGPPVLAARIQELFGLETTPSVAGGRVPVLLHLLAPNGRPQQVTTDLRSFWNETYPEVRKELRARYPKHAWPEDPWSATPQRRPRRRRK